MKISIIGSTSYRAKMEAYRQKMQSQGHSVRMPLFDFDARKEIDIATQNREHIEWADEVHIFWDGRSLGTVWDISGCWHLRKPMYMMEVNPMSFRSLVEECVLYSKG